MACMSANHLLKGGSLLLISTCTRTITTTTHHTRSLLLPKPNLTSPPLSLLHLTNISTPIPRRHVRPICATSEAPTATEEAQPEVGGVGAVREAAGLLDIRVGRILKAWRHPEADTLYVEEVDIGENEPRTICSGLVKFVNLDHLQDKKVVVLANLKPRNMRGIKSCGMLMAASDASHENVELLVPPEDSVPGERIWFGLEEEKENQPAAASPNQIQKKKVWESVQPHLKTDAAGVAMLDGHYMMTSVGPVLSRSLKNANIS